MLFQAEPGLLTGVQLLRTMFNGMSYRDGKPINVLITEHWVVRSCLRPVRGEERVA